MEKIAVIIPTYNRVAFLQEAVESVKQQTFPHWECYVVDDASTDETPTVMAQLQATDSRIHYIRLEKNKGTPGGPRNVALRQTDAHWLAFLDDDDYWVPDKLAAQAERLKADPDIQVLFGRIQKFGNDSIVWPKDGYPARPTLGQLINGNVIPVATVIMRAELLRAMGGFEEQDVFCADYDLWLRIAARGHKIVGMDKVLCHYRVHDSAITYQYDHEVDRLFAIYEKLQRDFQLPSEMFRIARRRLYLRRAEGTPSPVQKIHYWLKALRVSLGISNESTRIHSLT